ncbi:hypothetical protein [Prevotella sp. 10(H)]|uniref:hypothetical protein n=1 Tax=Prevotella sp. 10(H) TaxID=1158294 RepID=UPI0004A74529|nr:hypothetical protein [Prevotella sp. 10(H)]
MKGKYRYFFLILVIALGFLIQSCDREDSSYTKNVEGHWIHAGTKAEVYVTEPSLKQPIEDYIKNRYKENNVSYEFKNDRTYYFYQNYSEPLKGIYKTIDKSYYQIDDLRGEKSVVREDSSLYVVSDVREEVAKELKLDKNKILKANAMDIFERGLFPNQ